MNRNPNKRKNLVRPVHPVENRARVAAAREVSLRRISLQVTGLMHCPKPRLTAVPVTVGKALVGVCVLLGLGLPVSADDSPAALLEIERAFVDTIARVEPSVVAISRLKVSQSGVITQRFDPFGIDRRSTLTDADNPNSPDFIPNEFGSAIIFAPADQPGQRMLLTNYHVVHGGPIVTDTDQVREYRLHARFHSGHGCDVKIVAADPRSDLAVLQIDFESLGNSPGQLKPVTFAAKPDYAKGKLVLALGNAYAQGRDGSASASWGMISNVFRRPAPWDFPFQDARRTRQSETIHHLGTLLQVDTRLNLGTSGGALVNLRGELIGLTTSLAAVQGFEKSAGYAIPFDQATARIVADLSRGYEVEYGFLGLIPNYVSQTKLRKYSREFSRPWAVEASQVVGGSPADQAGLQQDDVILAINDQPVRSHAELMRDIGLLPPSSEITLRLWRDRSRKELTVKARLGKWPVQNEDEIIATASRHQPWKGLLVDYPTGRYRYFRDRIQYLPAVAVSEVLPGSPCERAQLQPGDFITHVNGKAVQTPDEFFQAVKRSQKKQTRLTVYPQREVVLAP